MFAITECMAHVDIMYFFITNPITEDAYRESEQKVPSHIQIIFLS
jgi:hypothetical protein